MPLDEYILVQAHREAYRALVDSALRSRGDKAKLARELDISPEYLSNLRNSKEDSFDYGRTPGPELAHRMAITLPFDRAQRDEFLEHVAYVWTWEHRYGRLRGIEAFYEPQSHSPIYIPLGTSRQAGYVGSQVWNASQFTELALTELATEVAEAREVATATTDSALARKYYKAIKEASTLLLARTNAREQPIEFVYLCLLLHDTVCILNRPGKGVFLARIATEVMEELEEGDSRSGARLDRGRIRHLKVNVLVAQCLTYRYLNMPKRADALAVEAERRMERLRSPEATIWARHIYEHRLKAISEMPRFSLRIISDLAQKAREAQVRQTGEMTAHADLRIADAEARGYLRYGTQKSAREAYLILRDRVEKLHAVAGYGPVHKSHLLRTYASILRKLGDQDGWAHYIRSSLEIAAGAGLDHQISEARRAYGPTVIDTIIKQFDAGSFRPSQKSGQEQ
jgi:hypothetical protein